MRSSALLKPRQKLEDGRDECCVLTSYVSTLYYLAAELEQRGIPSMLLHGSMGGETQREAWQRFEDGDSVLLATNVVTNEGLDLSKVTNLILYDLPRNKIALLQTIGRFDSVGRVRRLSIYVFRSDDGQDLTQLQLLSSLHEIIEGNGN
jgi:superfamily II DNA/RNA helicase